MYKKKGKKGEIKKKRLRPPNTLSDIKHPKPLSFSFLLLLPRYPTLTASISFLSLDLISLYFVSSLAFSLNSLLLFSLTPHRHLHRQEGRAAVLIEQQSTASIDSTSATNPLNGDKFVCYSCASQLRALTLSRFASNPFAHFSLCLGKSFVP